MSVLEIVQFFKQQVPSIGGVSVEIWHKFDFYLKIRVLHKNF